MSYSKETHSFGVHLAIKYGMEKAALIHHFQHWINLNKRKKSSTHFRNGHWWMYQKRSEMNAALPYLSEDSIRHHCEGLVEEGVLKTGNFNKLKIDKTLWYAFVDEEAFLDPEIEEKFTKGENPNRGGENPNPCGENPKAIPDPKSSDPKTTDKEIHKKGSSTPPSADAEGLLELFLTKIKERNPEFKDPNRAIWLSEMDKLLRIDKRSVEKTREIIIWASTHKWFKTACLSPGKLRKDYDSMLMQMEAGREEEMIFKNRQFALNLKEKYPEQLKALTFDKNFVGNRSSGKEIPFKLPHEQFKELFISLFGGSYVR